MCTFPIILLPFVLDSRLPTTDSVATTAKEQKKIVDVSNAATGCRLLPVVAKSTRFYLHKVPAAPACALHAGVGSGPEDPSLQSQPGRRRGLDLQMITPIFQNF